MYPNTRSASPSGHEVAMDLRIVLGERGSGSGRAVADDTFQPWQWELKGYAPG